MHIAAGERDGQATDDRREDRAAGVGAVSGILRGVRPGDELAAIHGLGRLQLSKAEADGLEHEVKTLMLEFGDGGEDDIAGRYRTKDTTRLLSYLRQCNDICLRATNAHINRVALTLH
jgi:hypothetical protein